LFGLDKPHPRLKIKLAEMGLVRKVVLGVLLTGAAAVLVVSGWELWNYRQWTSLPLPLNESGFSPDDRARMLQDRMELLTKRLGDMELLVVLLLGASGLYAVVFVASSYFSATSLARQADQTIGNIQDQVGLALGDLRELEERTENRLHEMMAMAVPAPPVAAAPGPAAAPVEEKPQVSEIAERVKGWQNQPLTERDQRELVRDEYAAICLDALADSRADSVLAGVFLGLARVYASSDYASSHYAAGDRIRSRFHLERAVRLVPPESALASEIHYDLALSFAASQDFPYAMRELTAAFEHQFQALEEKLAADIEEGGVLYDLASTPPFDKAVNDLLLNMSIGIG
jgi:hypothetical protein